MSDSRPVMRIKLCTQVDKNSITIGGQKQYHCIVMADFLTALSGMHPIT